MKREPWFAEWEKDLEIHSNSDSGEVIDDDFENIIKGKTPQPEPIPKEEDMEEDDKRRLEEEVQRVREYAKVQDVPPENPEDEELTEEEIERRLAEREEADSHGVVH